MSDQADQPTTGDDEQAELVTEGPVREEPEVVPGDEDRNP
jgi:hypothetical protein